MSDSTIPARAYADLWAYHLAPSGEGPHVADWLDKPHRLVYDLTRLAAEARADNKAIYERAHRLERENAALLEDIDKLKLARQEWQHKAEKYARRLVERGEVIEGHSQGRGQRDARYRCPCTPLGCRDVSECERLGYCADAGRPEPCPSKHPEGPMEDTQQK